MPGAAILSMGPPEKPLYGETQSREAAILPRILWRRPSWNGTRRGRGHLRSKTGLFGGIGAKLRPSFIELRSSTTACPNLPKSTPFGRFYFHLSSVPSCVCVFVCSLGVYYN